eukprot:164005_1
MTFKKGKKKRFVDTCHMDQGIYEMSTTTDQTRVSMSKSLALNVFYETRKRLSFSAVFTGYIHTHNTRYHYQSQCKCRSLLSSMKNAMIGFCEQYINQRR